MLNNKTKSGEYATFLYNKRIIGGCIFYNRDGKNDKIFWTSNWWLFVDNREIKVEFYSAKDTILKVIGTSKAKLDISHNVIIGKINKGSIRIICN